MKKKGKMAACLILLVLLLAVLVVLTKKNSTADADSSSSDSGADAEKVVDFSKDDVTALSFRINGETVSFTKTAGDDDTDIWTYDQEDGFPLDEGKITSVLSSLSSMTAERVIEGDEIDSMADFGLETPSQEVVVTAGDEKTTIHVGDKNSSSRYYIYLNDDTSKVYLVSTSLETMFPGAFEAERDGSDSIRYHASLGRRAAHVERQHLADTLCGRRIQCRQHARGRPGFQQENGACAAASAEENPPLETMIRRGTSL